MDKRYDEKTLNEIEVKSNDIILIYKGGINTLIHVSESLTGENF